MSNYLWNENLSPEQLEDDVHDQIFLEQAKVAPVLYKSPADSVLQCSSIVMVKHGPFAHLRRLQLESLDEESI